jgi:hypothetical protein
MATVLVAAWAAVLAREGLLRQKSRASRWYFQRCSCLRGVAPPRLHPARAGAGLAGWQAGPPLVARALGLQDPSGGALGCTAWTPRAAAAALLGEPGSVDMTRRRSSSPAASPRALGVPPRAWSSPFLASSPPSAVHETFGGRILRAGGFFFHRLRLARLGSALVPRGGHRAPALFRPDPRARRRARRCLRRIILPYARAALFTACSCRPRGVVVTRARVSAPRGRWCWCSRPGAGEPGLECAPRRGDREPSAASGLARGRGLGLVHQRVAGGGLAATRAALVQTT